MQISRTRSPAILEILSFSLALLNINPVSLLLYFATIQNTISTKTTVANMAEYIHPSQPLLQPSSPFPLCPYHNILTNPLTPTPRSLTTSTAIADDSVGHSNKTTHNISPTAPGTTSTEHEHEKKGILGKIKEKLSPSSNNHGGSQGAVGGDGTHIGRDEGVKHAFGGTAVNSETMHRGPAAGADLNRE
ncbi:hypothetical protein BKA65DRAFT_493161 [Rhexocercosporidium sp. MPI-PUGE-AT-0058]|nr:hypothetical protein BKA65DRAFT_493161 [Rhexocercosporidium sp. MPI-PUGE-AT-0058]